MKDLLPPSSYLTITDTDAARALTDSEVRRLLTPFIDGERSVKEAAAVLGLSLNAALYRVRRLERLNLIYMAREETRKGRAIKYYRAVAEGFFIPYAATPFETPGEWIVQDFRAREEQLLRSAIQSGLVWGEGHGRQGFGKRIFRRADGILEADFAFSFEQEADLLLADAPAVVSYLVETELEDESAKALQKELVELVKRYERRGRGKRYLLRLGLAPAPTTE